MEQLKKLPFMFLQKYSRILVRKHSGVSWLHHEGRGSTLTWVHTHIWQNDAEQLDAR